MTVKERAMLAVVRPMLPMVRSQLTPLLEQFVGSELAEMREKCGNREYSPIIILMEDSNKDIFVVEAYVEGTEIVSTLRRMPLAVLASKIVSLFDDID